MADQEGDLESPYGPVLSTAALAVDLVDVIVAMLSVPVSRATGRLMRRRTAGSGTSGNGCGARAR